MGNQNILHSKALNASDIWVEYILGPSCSLRIMLLPCQEGEAFSCLGNKVELGDGSDKQNAADVALLAHRRYHAFLPKQLL